MSTSWSSFKQPQDITSYWQYFFMTWDVLRTGRWRKGQWWRRWMWQNSTELHCHLPRCPVHPPGFGTARHRASSVAPGCPLWCLRKEKKRLKTQSLEQCRAGFIQIHSIFWIVSGFSEEECGNLIDFMDQELLEKTIWNNVNYESPMYSPLDALRPTL